ARIPLAVLHAAEFLRQLGTEPPPEYCDHKIAVGRGRDLRLKVRVGAGDIAFPKKEVHRHLCRGYADVVDADLSKYFDTIPHSELIKSVARRVVDRNVLRLIKMWLRGPIEEED